MSVVMRRRRLPDGSYSELERVFEGETSEEKIEKLREERDVLGQELANLKLKLIMGGVI